MSCRSEAYLGGSGLSLATVAGRGRGAARWLSGLQKGSQNVTVLVVYLVFPWVGV